MGQTCYHKNEFHSNSNVYLKSFGFIQAQFFFFQGAQDHLNVLIVCALESELQAAIAVLESGTNSKFENKYTHHSELSRLNVRVCEEWNSSDIKVGVVAQTDTGGTESQMLLANLAKFFKTTVVVMTGTCAGEENTHGYMEHGCVFVVNRATVEMGGTFEEGGNLQARAQYCELEKGILAAVNELVHSNSDVWLKYVPENAFRPSPRYLQQLILDLVIKSGQDGITKRDLLDKMVDKKLPGMSTMRDDTTHLTYDKILNTMLQSSSAWVTLPPTAECRYFLTNLGERYAANEAIFPRHDNIVALVDSMLSVPHKDMNLKAELSTYKERVADKNVKAVDMEAFYFMKQAIDSFKRNEVSGRAVVMKGICDYGFNASKGGYFHVHAASTPVAFLRHLMTVKQHLFGNYISLHSN